MRLLLKLPRLLLTSFLLGTCLPQSIEPWPVLQPKEDRSFYLDEHVPHPEALSGIWETATGPGGAVGIHLELGTRLPDDTHIPWSSQGWQHLEIGVFERKTADKQFGEMNGFSDSVRGGGLTYKSGRLLLHHASLGKGPLAVDLDLSLHTDDCWHGRLHRNSFDQRVSLCRPAPRPKTRLNLLVGTWSEKSAFPTRCVHVAQISPNLFTGWADTLQVPGRLAYAPTVHGPHSLYERYGSLVKVVHLHNDIVRVEFGAYNGICCPHIFIGKLNARGSMIEGAIETFPVTFARVHGDSCVR